MPTSSKYIIRFIIDFTLLCAVASPILFLYLFAQPFQRGFNCKDDSIRYPFKESTISTIAAYIIGTSIPIVFMSTIEYFRVKNGLTAEQFQFCGKNLHGWYKAMYSTVGTFLFGCACSQLATDIGKYSIGRLRPNFLDVCKPDWSQIDCSEDTEDKYIDPIPCLTDDLENLRESRLSFPSGHSSYMAFTMIYTMIYLQMRLELKIGFLIKPVIQLGCFLLAFYTTLSRVSDYKHHWSDVLSGFIIGTIVAILVSVYVSDIFVIDPNPAKKPEEELPLHCHPQSTDRTLSE